MKQNLKPAVNLTALVLAAGLLMGLVTGCKQKIDPKPQKVTITVKGDERTDIPSDHIKIDLTPAKTWQDIQGDVANKVILKAEWPGSDYEVYEWRLDDENGTKLTDDYQIKSHITVYAVTNYAKFNIIDNKIKLTAEGKGYTGADPKGKIIIHDEITEIEDGQAWGKGAFRNCTEISSVKFPQALTKIGENAFEGCTGLTSLDLSACTSLTTIGGYAFYSCTGLTSVHLPANLTTIDQYAFYKCTGLTSLSLPANLTTIGVAAFYGCTGLTSLTIDSANAKYKTEGNILYNKAGTILIFAAGGLTSINIPDTVTTIDVGAFAGCTGLTSVDLPANLTTIDQYAFYKCTGLTSVVFVDKNNWKVYDDEAHTQNETEIGSSDLDNAATAAKYLREETYNGGYCDKWWKKN